MNNGKTANGVTIKFNNNYVFCDNQILVFEDNKLTEVNIENCYIIPKDKINTFLDEISKADPK